MAFEIMIAVACWTGFSLIHSLTVSDRWHAWLRARVGEQRFVAYHRLVYTIISFATLAIVVAILRSLPDRPLYEIQGHARLLFRLMQLAGVALLLWTPLSLPEFLGIRQALRFAATGKNPEEAEAPRLYTGKSYSIVRHPLYLGCSALVAFRPEQTIVSAVSSTCIVLYFYVGTFHEEARLARLFGEEYRAYRRRVPRLLPIRLLGTRR